jgi:hypothetical protein
MSEKTDRLRALRDDLMTSDLLAAELGQDELIRQIVAVDEKIRLQEENERQEVGTSLE